MPDQIDFSARLSGWRVVLANPDATFSGWNLGAADRVFRDGKSQLVLSCVQLVGGATEFWVRRFIDGNTICRFDAETVTHFCR